MASITVEEEKPKSSPSTQRALTPNSANFYLLSPQFVDQGGDNESIRSKESLNSKSITDIDDTNPLSVRAQEERGAVLESEQSLRERSLSDPIMATPAASEPANERTNSKKSTGSVSQRSNAGSSMNKSQRSEKSERSGKSSGRLASKKSIMRVQSNIPKADGSFTR